MHGLPARLQVLGSGLLRPALEVEPQDDGATLGWIRNLMVGRKAALLALWKWLGSLEIRLIVFASGRRPVRA